MRMSLFTIFGKNMPRVFMAGMNGALVGKRLEAMRSPYARRSCMASALSSICVRQASFVALSSGGIVWVGVLSVARSLLRFVCMQAAADLVSPRTSLYMFPNARLSYVLWAKCV